MITDARATRSAAPSRGASCKYPRISVTFQRSPPCQWYSPLPVSPGSVYYRTVVRSSVDRWTVVTEGSWNDTSLDSPLGYPEYPSTGINQFCPSFPKRMDNVVYEADLRLLHGGIVSVAHWANHHFSFAFSISLTE